MTYVDFVGATFPIGTIKGIVQQLVAIRNAIIVVVSSSLKKHMKAELP